MDALYTQDPIEDWANQCLVQWAFEKGLYRPGMKVTKELLEEFRWLRDCSKYQDNEKLGAAQLSLPFGGG